MNATTLLTDTQTAESEVNSSAPGRSSSYEPSSETPSLFGGSSSMTADNKGSTVPPSATKVRTGQVSLCDKLTPLLISHGLVKGTIPSSIRKRSGPVIPGIASWLQDGDDAESERSQG
jgi:hypothetical protein